MNCDESDEQLLERYAQGDAQAFELFFSRHRARVYYYTLKRLHEPELAAELTQDVFLKLHAKIHLYKQGESALSWFFTIVHNACLDELRRITLARRALQSVAEEGQMRHSENGLPQPSLGSEELSESLKNSMQLLNDEQRRVMELRVVSGKSFKQIADETGKNEPALRKIYSRAVDRLRQWFSAEGEDNDERK